MQAFNVYFLISIGYFLNLSFVRKLTTPTLLCLKLIILILLKKTIKQISMTAIRNMVLKSKVLDKLDQKCKRCSFKNILYILRMIYVGIATVVVCYGFHKGYKKLVNNDILVREQVYALDKMKYPSITFCYKFKHGSKDVVQNYYPHLFEMAKKKGI